MSKGFTPTNKAQKKFFEFSETLLLKTFCNLIPIINPTHCYVHITKFTQEKPY
jgi:hypothetical protein